MSAVPVKEVFMAPVPVIYAQGGLCERFEGLDHAIRPYVLNMAQVKKRCARFEADIKTIGEAIAKWNHADPRAAGIKALLAEVWTNFTNYREQNDDSFVPMINAQLKILSLQLLYYDDLEHRGLKPDQELGQYQTWG